jgi:hypothetical protein
VEFAPGVSAFHRAVFWEVETSGGLLVAVPSASAHSFVDACAKREQTAWQIGDVIHGEGIVVV